MKKRCISLLLVTFFVSGIFPQTSSLIRDVSPDGQQVIEYSPDQLKTPGRGFNQGDVPLPTQPDWQSTLERQVGGLVWADYDRDGDLDLAVGCYHSQSFPPINEFENQVYENIGGTLTSTPAWVSSDMRSTTDVRWADINGDGYPELYASNGDFSLSPSVIYFNSPQGLSPTPSWIATDNTWSLGAAFGDVDGDGDLDLAVANQGDQVIPTRPIYIFYNNNGNLSTSPGWQSADEMISNAVAWADMDNSDIQTATVIDSSGHTVIMLPHLPIARIDSVKIDGQKTDKFSFDPISGWVSISPVAIPDTTGTPTIEIHYAYPIKGDLAATKWVNYESGIYFNLNGTLNTLPGWTVGNTESHKGLAWADYDLDGDMDLAIGGSSVPTVLYENVNGTLSSQPVWSSNNSHHSCQDLIWGDVNRDGYPDLATVHFGNGHVRVYLNRQGVLDSTPSWYYDCSSSATAIAWGDVNNDGFLDLAVGTARQPVMVFINTSVDTVTAINNSQPTQPVDFELFQNYPNPFNPSTRIKFRIKKQVSTPVELAVFDLRGNKVRVLLNEIVQPGEIEMEWDGRNEHGETVSTGIYFYRLVAGNQVASRKMILLH